MGTVSETEWENELLGNKVDTLLDVIVSLEEKFREIYRTRGEDEEISKLCNESFEIINKV